MNKMNNKYALLHLLNLSTHPVENDVHSINQSINQDILNAPANKYHVGAHGKMNGIKIKLNGNKCTTKKLICICIRF